MNNNFNELTVDNNHRGTIVVSLLTVKKIILYAIHDMTHQYFVDKVECLMFDNSLLHIYISGKVIKKENLNDLTAEINEAIMKELSYSLQIKPKNISITYHH
ncbi:MMB_0454 family protein [Spiroplasma endosymbiont of Polydrusus pterygomalis]|uniref:MMB_0454 family protein n=1 Tax=Spiroplasma endosymbiont of Polydrusus pterygomalis TaxID=3139327 RepID=UPI003CCAE3C0